VSHLSTAGTARRGRALRAALAVPALAAVTALAAASSAQATMASTTYDHQNTTCADISEHLKELKVEWPEEGTHDLDDGYLRGSYTVTEGKRLDWSSDSGMVEHVLVKGGDGTNRYDYDGSEGDIDLYAPDNASGGPADLSHFTFCYDDDNRGHVKIVKKAMPADTYERFAFHGSYGLAPQDFELADGEMKELRPKPGTYTVEEAAKDGWEVDYIACEDSDSYGTDSYGQGRTATINVDPDEYITCTFYNKKQYKPEPEAPMPPAVTPPAVVTPMAPASAPAPVAARPAPAQAVKATTVARGAAGLRRAAGCVSRTVRVTVKGSPIGRIVFAVDGRRVKTVAAAKGQRRYAATLPVGAGRVHRVTARVSFSNGAPSRTLRTTVVRCAQQQVAPQFTG
jgi:hypothetical protein